MIIVCADGRGKVDPMTASRQEPASKSQWVPTSGLALRQINWAITYRCNSRCMNCHLWNPANGSKRSTLPELSVDEYRRFYDSRMPDTVTDVAYGGGEPTIHDALEELIRLPPPRVRVSFSTNALMLERALCAMEAVHSRGDGGVQVSIDGVGEVHDQMRGIKGSYEKAVRFLEAAQRRDIFRSVSFTINRLNAHTVWDTYCLARDHGAAFCARPAEPYVIYGMRSDEASLRFTPDDIELLRAMMLRINGDAYDRNVHIDYTSLAFRHLMPAYLSRIIKGPPCHAVSTACMIDPFGQVAANCEHCPELLGSIRDQRLVDIWQNREALRLREYAYGLRCRSCWNDCQVLENLYLEQNLVLTAVDELLLARQDRGRLPSVFDWSGSDDRRGLGCGWSGILPAPEGLGGFLCRYAKQKSHLFACARGDYFYLHAVCPGERIRPACLSIAFFNLNDPWRPELKPEYSCCFEVAYNRWSTVIVPTPKTLKNKNVLLTIESSTEWKPHASSWPAGFLASRLGFVSAIGGLKEWLMDNLRRSQRVIGRIA